VFYIGTQKLLFQVLQPRDIQWAVNISYASLAVVVLTPMALVLVRTRFRHVGWVAAGVISFVIAWFFRLVDHELATTLPMGSHWLWHTFGAITTVLIIEYFYLVEGEGKEGDESHKRDKWGERFSNEETADAKPVVNPETDRIM
jgi:hypothetical protein